MDRTGFKQCKNFSMSLHVICCFDVYVDEKLWLKRWLKEDPQVYTHEGLMNVNRV